MELTTLLSSCDKAHLLFINVIIDWNNKNTDTIDYIIIFMIGHIIYRKHIIKSSQFNTCMMDCIILVNNKITGNYFLAQ